MRIRKGYELDKSAVPPVARLLPANVAAVTETREGSIFRWDSPWAPTPEHVEQAMQSVRRAGFKVTNYHSGDKDWHFCVRCPPDVLRRSLAGARMDARWKMQPVQFVGE